MSGRLKQTIKLRPAFKPEALASGCGRIVEAIIDLELMVAANLRHHPRVVMRFGPGALVTARAGKEPGTVDVISDSGARVVIDDYGLCEALTMLGDRGAVVRDVGLKSAQRGKAGGKAVPMQLHGPRHAAGKKYAE